MHPSSPSTPTPKQYCDKKPAPPTSTAPLAQIDTHKGCACKDVATCVSNTKYRDRHWCFHKTDGSCASSAGTWGNCVDAAMVRGAALLCQRAGTNACSGHGTCGTGGACVCSGGYTGSNFDVAPLAKDTEKGCKISESVESTLVLICCRSCVCVCVCACRFVAAICKGVSKSI